MAARKQTQLIDLPLSAKGSAAVTEFVANLDQHARYAKDAAQAAWFATRRDNVEKRNAVRQALIAKYKLQ